MNVPQEPTLRKYGITLDEWLEMYWKYGGRCHVCLQKQSPKAKRALHIEHKHVKGWKAMPPEEKKKHVRGICCFICNNRLLTRGVTPEKLRNAADYLDKHEKSKLS